MGVNRIVLCVPVCGGEARVSFKQSVYVSILIYGHNLWVVTEVTSTGGGSTAGIIEIPLKDLELLSMIG